MAKSAAKMTPERRAPSQYARAGTRGKTNLSRFATTPLKAGKARAKKGKY